MAMPEPLISVAELKTLLGDVIVCDIRWRLTEPDAGRALFLEAHIPGAVFVDLDKDLSGSPGERGRHPLPSADSFRKSLGRLGIAPDSHVVVYDDVSGMVAARMWWMLRAIGHTDVQLLDGGFSAWIGEGGATSSGEESPEPRLYGGDVDFAGSVEIDQLDDRQLVDVRATERYRGETEPVDPRPGHIPGAISLPAGTLLSYGRLRPPDDLREALSHLDEPVMACGSGVNASFTALAYEVAFGSIPDVYPGSYSEWSRSNRPVQIGDQP
jgi:thiosulfate/3-mercaptopyruvate sulfurtransferase